MSSPPFSKVRPEKLSYGDELLDDQGRVVAVVYYGSEELMITMRQWLEEQIEVRAFNAD